MALVLAHPDHGIFLGHCMGLTFWSKIDPVGQPSAPTFADNKEIDDALATWLAPLEDKDRLTRHVVTPDDGHYASIAACVAAGLEGWVDSETPVANERSC